MRQEYHIYQRLVWDSGFRSEFKEDRTGTLARHYPDYVDRGLFSETATLPGLEEEAYRRIAALHHTTKLVFPLSHHLILTFCGKEFFERILAGFYNFKSPDEENGSSLEILEPFDGYVVGPMILHQIAAWESEEAFWIEPAMRYEWAVWHARRVASGWPPVSFSPPLAEGTTLVSADFDLKALLTEVKRLAFASVGAEVYNWRIKPGPGTYCSAVYPLDGDVVEAKLDPQSFAELTRAVEVGPCEINQTLRDSVAQIGLVLDTSFLCCTREMADLDSKKPDMSNVVEPQPH